ncbi:MAG TPA: alpha-L-arabinofuranosidase C-terminal domain-containing protein, partial [Segetibacter sp.]
KETYKGSIWARGDGRAKLAVKLLQGDTLLAEQTLGVPSTKWNEYFFSLKPTASTVAGKIAFIVSGGTMQIDQASMMSEASIKNGGYRPDLYKAVADIQPTSLRWPGGSFASGYNWKWGIGTQAERIRIPKSSWDDFEQNAFGTDEFMALCKRINSEPVFVINIGYNKSDNDRPALIKEAQEWVEYCNGPATSTWGKVRAKNGHPLPYNVKYWEIDNEMWELGVEKYDELLRMFVPALKKVDPTIKIIACGDFTVNGKNTDSLLFFHSGKYFDYISLHHYEGANGFATGPVNSAKKYAGVARMIAACPNPAIKMYISEWNASETDWRTGLYAGGILNAFEKEPAIAMGAAALFLRRTDASGWNNSFVNFDNTGWFGAPNYVVTKFYYDHFAPYRLALTGDAKQLNVVATQSADRQKIFIKAVNPINEATTVRVSINGITPGWKPVLELVAPGSLQATNTLSEPDNVHVMQSAVVFKDNIVEFVLPALSVGILSMSKK